MGQPIALACAMPLPCRPATTAAGRESAQRACGWAQPGMSYIQPSVQARQRRKRGQALVASASRWVETEGRALGTRLSGQSHWPQQPFPEIGLCFIFSFNLIYQKSS